MRWRELNNLGVLIFLMMLAVLAIFAMMAVDAKADEKVTYETFDDPLPVTQTFESDGTIRRITRAIYTSKRKAGVWYQCGKRIEREDWWASAEEWSIQIWTRHRETGQPLRDFLGVAAQESGFDPCALGPHPRDWAYRNGLLKPSKLTISHQADDVLALINSPAWQRHTAGIADLGAYQVLHPRFTGRTRGINLSALPEELQDDQDYLRALDPAEVMTVTGSVLSGARQLAIRAARFGTDRPGATWPGRYSPRYRQRIDWWVDRIMEWKALER